MIKQKELSYQKNAINSAIEHLQNNHEFKLQSPTGSGKTYIIAKIIDQYLENDILNNNNTSFLFVAPSTGSLDFQGYEKINTYLKKDWTKGYSTQHIGTSNRKGSGNKSYLQNIDYFEPNKVYFIGWQMFKSGTRITEIDSERNDIYKVISNTKNRNINIVLIIDEAHREISTKKEIINTKNEILQHLDPYKIIKVSATLEQNNEKPDYKITYNDVRDEAAIKQNVIISSLNQSIENLDEYDENEQLIISAIKKQEQIKKSYRKHKININPLILIQIPDGVSIDEFKTDKELIKKIKNFLEENGYKEGYNFAIWLDKEKTIKDKNELVDNNSPIDILIFKQAIATGWDIPRANILVRIRESKKDSFNIQTLGRILRNPFFKYYDNELIDNAFVYTKDENYKNYIKQESIVSDENEYVVVKRSKTSKNSKFTLNKLLIKVNDNYNQEEMINNIVNKIIATDEFKEKFIKVENRNNLVVDLKIDSKTIIDNDASKINDEIKKNISQPHLNLFGEAKITLFDLYIKFRTITKSSNFIQQVLEEFSKNISKLNITIKQFYKACIENWNKELWVVNDNNMRLKDYIEYLRNQEINKNTTNYFEEYHLPTEYKVSTTKYNINEWDGINTFDVKLLERELDSIHEEEFYKEWEKINIKDVHIFRNGTNRNNDYFVEYIDEENKIRTFFPDFIMINEKTKNVLILEGKGGTSDKNIDSKTNYKKLALMDLLENSTTTYKYIFKKAIIFSYNENEREITYRDWKEQRTISYNDVKEIINEKCR